MSKSIKVMSLVFVVFAVALLLQVSVSNAQPFAVMAVVDNAGGLRGSGTLTFTLPTFLQSLFAKNMSDCCADVEIQGHSLFTAVGALLGGSFNVPSYQSYFFTVGPWETFREKFGGIPIGQLLTIKVNWTSPIKEVFVPSSVSFTTIGLGPGLGSTVCPSELDLSFFMSQ